MIPCTTKSDNVEASEQGRRDKIINNYYTRTVDIKSVFERQPNEEIKMMST